MLTERLHGQIAFGLDGFNPIQVSIQQFYGIEINDFAATVAKTALWIAESQMMQLTEDIVHMSLDFLPLKSYVNITEGNALRIDWNAVVPASELSYIMGNPPFVGKKEQSKEQKQDIQFVFGDKAKGVGNLDYVSGWYLKAAKYIQSTNVHVAFVSTNSITQGEQVPILWRQLSPLDTNIIFAHRTFQWDSEATLKAHVHCVIIGFTVGQYSGEKVLYQSGNVVKVNSINPYLVNAPSIYVESQSKSICPALPIYYGSMPIDNGYLTLTDDDVKTLIDENPNNAMFVREYIGGNELINGSYKKCLWLYHKAIKEIRQSRFITERIRLTEEFRRSSNRPQTVALADTPMLFGEIRQPDSTMLVIPKVSSEKRRYIPMAFVEASVIVSGSALIIPNADKYTFGVLMSNVHNAWMRTVGGRLEMRYQYSGTVVYNTFPWCTPTDAQRAKIEQTAQAILDARALYPNDSLADLYDELTMPPELRKAHQQNDRAVMEAYGMSVKETTESTCVAELMRRYQNLTAPADKK